MRSARGIVKLGFNLANGSTLDAIVDELLSAAVETIGMRDAPPHMELPPDWTQAQLKSRVARALPERVEAHLAPFLKGMKRRLKRDLARVHDYFESLCTESQLRLRKLIASGEAESSRERLRLEAIAREYELKVADLRQKYALSADVAWSQTLEIVMPVASFEILIKRRKGERKIVLDWNPLARKLDTPPCEWSYTRNAVRRVCDDRLHLICPAAHAPCANCERAYCRACHSLECPKCHRREEQAPTIH
jgi:hypothetical protein